MKIIKYLGGPLIIAFLAFVCQIIDQKFGGSVGLGTTWGWLAFQSWAAYFIAGCTVKGGVKAFAAYIVGMIASNIITKNKEPEVQTPLPTETANTDEPNIAKTNYAP
ncbi:MAG: hypothetical protein RR630_11060, partial [Coprobacillus sp.]